MGSHANVRPGNVLRAADSPIPPLHASFPGICIDLRDILSLHLQDRSGCEKDLQHQGCPLLFTRRALR